MTGAHRHYSATDRGAASGRAVDGSGWERQEFPSLGRITHLALFREAASRTARHEGCSPARAPAGQNHWRW